MKTQKEIIKSKAYWFEKNQNLLFRELHNYMIEHKKNQSDIAREMNVTRGYISQILNGNFNPSLKKLIEFAIYMGKVPNLEFIPQDTFLKKKQNHDKDNEYKQKRNTTYKVRSFDKPYSKVSDAKRKKEAMNG